MNSTAGDYFEAPRYLTRWTSVGSGFALMLGAPLVFGVIYLVLWRMVAAAWYWQESVHVTFLVAVLTTEMYILGHMLRETRGRRAMISSLEAFRLAMSRDSYLREIEAAIRMAKRSILFTTVTMEPSWKSDGQRRIVDAVKAREAESDAYVHRGLVAPRLEALAGTIELLCSTKIKLKICHLITHSRVRYVVQDDEVSIIGVAEVERDLVAGAKATTMCFRVDSKVLARALEAQFDSWFERSDAQTPWEYLNSEIEKVLKEEGKWGKQDVRDLLHLSKLADDVAKRAEEALIANCPAYEKLE